MNNIFKYELKIEGQQVITMPENAEILTVQQQNGKLILWAIVMTSAKPEKYLIEIYGTGHPFPSTGEKRKYISTVQMDGLVWHIFKV